MKNIIKRVIIGVLIGVILMSIRSCNVKAAINFTKSGDNLNNLLQIGGQPIGSNYYYETASGVWDQSTLRGLFLISEEDIKENVNANNTGTTYKHFVVEFCVNGGQPNFEIWSSYYNDVDFIYNTQRTIYLSNGDWSLASCYIAFVRLQFNVTYLPNYYNNIGVYSYTPNNNVFALQGNDGFNKLLRYTNIIYYDDGNYNTALDNARVIGQNNSIIQGQQDIINNQTNNTNTIINNQNSNTTSLINQLISGTNATIEANKVCKLYDNTQIYFNDSYLQTNGNLATFNASGVTNYINITGATIDLLQKSNSANLQMCFYDMNKNYISCNSESNVNIGTLNIPSNAYYFRGTINKSQNKPQFKICKDGNQALTETQEQTNQTLSNIENSITDESGPTLGTLNNSAGWLPAGPVDSILNLPLSLLNNLTTSLGNSCTPAELDVPLVDSTIILPCMNDVYQEIGISAWVTGIGIIASAFILFSYLAKLYKWVDDTLTFRENNHIDNWGGV